jgi:hypothetical protein
MLTSSLPVAASTVTSCPKPHERSLQELAHVRLVVRNGDSQFLGHGLPCRSLGTVTRISAPFSPRSDLDRTAVRLDEASRDGHPKPVPRVFVV